MKYYLLTFFTILIIVGWQNAYATTMDTHFSTTTVLQDTLPKGKKADKQVLEKDKIATLPQTEDALMKVPKAKNKAIPKPIINPAIKITVPRIAPVKVKVKVNTQVKINL